MLLACASDCKLGRLQSQLVPKMISQQDIQALKDYVKGPSSQNQADSTVRLQVTHSNLKAHFMEIRLDLHVSVSTHLHTPSCIALPAPACRKFSCKLCLQMTISGVKQKLMSHTGSSPTSMQLQLKNENGRLLGQMTEDNRLLGFYSPYDG